MISYILYPTLSYILSISGYFGLEEVLSVFGSWSDIYPTMLLLVLIICSNFYVNHHIVKKKMSFLISFLSIPMSLISFSCFIALARTYSFCYIIAVLMGILLLLPILIKCFSSASRYDDCCGLWYPAFKRHGENAGHESGCFGFKTESCHLLGWRWQAI